MGFIDADDGIGYSSGEVKIERDLNNADAVDLNVRYNVINKKYSLRAILENLGIEYRGSNMYCPFHPDSLTGKPSAKYHEDTDLIYCFSESKVFSAYHALKLLMGKNMREVFRSVWMSMSDEEKKEALAEFGTDGAGEDIENPIWKKYEGVHKMFREGKVDFKKHKNALYKIFNIMGVGV